MEPFSVSEPCFHLRNQYPNADLLAMVLPGMTIREKKGFIRLWLSEGIPFAFSHAPMLFESIRSWLATLLNIHPKMVTIVGSARIGFSMAPKSYSQPFGDHSDLDFAIISDELFIKLREEFEQWRIDYENNVILPRTNSEKKYWPDNYEKGPKNIAKGFLDLKKIPFRYKYPNSQKIGNTLWKLNKKLEVTKIAPKVKASIRIYRDWEAFINQKLLSL